MAETHRKWEKTVKSKKKSLRDEEAISYRAVVLWQQGSKIQKRKKKLDKGSRFLFYFVTALLPWIQLSSESKRFSANEMTEEKYFLTYFRNLKMEFTLEMSEKFFFCKSQKETRIEY